MKNKGFTLIELLVVISIISLLSSVILASVKDAREKAQAKAFRENIIQFVNALELYRSTNNSYPGTLGSRYTSDINGMRTDNSSWTTSDLYNLDSQLSSYISKIPKPYKSTDTFSYRFKNTSGLLTKCLGDVIIPEYTVLVSSNVSTILGFEDWPSMSNSFDGINWSVTNTYKCFSIK